ncbi:MAG TPA: hypothetical protein VGX28_07270 [Frankiaceae bacterium]|nr:hypothetical protein [Frankiaceae bacterium]
MAFIQIVEYTTSKPDEVRALSERMRAERQGNGTVRRVSVGADREQVGRFFVIAEFDSYESAMENSDDPATQEMSAALGALMDAPPRFYNLDVVDQETF